MRLCATCHYHCCVLRMQAVKMPLCLSAALSYCCDRHATSPRPCSLLLLCVDCRLEADHSIVLRFVAGSMSDPAQEAALQAEQTQYGDILRLPVQVCRKEHATLSCMHRLFGASLCTSHNLHCTA